MIRRPPRSTLSSSSAASDVYKRQVQSSDLPEQAEVLGYQHVVDQGLEEPDLHRLDDRQQQREDQHHRYPTATWPSVGPEPADEFAQRDDRRMSDDVEPAVRRGQRGEKTPERAFDG